MNKSDIRFMGFDEEWEEKKLGDIAEITMGQSPDGSTYSDKPSTYILVQGNADMKNGFVCPRIWTTQKTKQAKKGDLIISVRAPVGEVGKTDYDIVIGRGVASISGDEFIFQSLKKMNEFGYWNSISCGSTFESINSNDLANAILTVPSKEEQTKIGELFSKIDTLISSTQKEHDKLVTLKKCMLQKMFPKPRHSELDSETLVPEIRFKGFTGDWEEKRLGEFGDVCMCKRIFKEQTSDKGDIPFYKIGTFGGIADSFISKTLFEEYKNNYPYPQKGAILISASGSIGRTVIYQGKDEYFQDSNIVWLEHNDNILDSFLKILYDNLKWNGIEGTTIKRLYNNNILNQRVTVPSLPEQKKIGVYFQNLDNLISKQAAELEKLKNVKKTLLSKMFV